MKVVHTIKDLQAELTALRAQGKKVGTPKRYPVFSTMMVTKSKIEPISRVFSAVNIIGNIL